MGSRSIGELLLRPSPLYRPLLSQASSNIRRTSPVWSSYRTITKSTSVHAAQPQPREDPENERPPPNATVHQAGAEQTSQAIDDLFSSMNNPAYRRTTPQRNPNSSDELRAARTSHIFGANFSSPRSQTHRRRPLDFNQMKMPDDDLNPVSQQPTPAVPAIPEAEKVYPRLGPNYGRGVNLDLSRGRDLVKGLGILAGMVARNNVKYDLTHQRYHERPGLKRKRLNSERWRAKFKKGFVQVTARVTELTRKGW